MDISKTQSIPTVITTERSVSDTLRMVYDALRQKGYNPVNQLVGYIMSGDPTYITNYNGARALIARLERDDILEELVSSYVKTLQD